MSDNLNSKVKNNSHNLKTGDLFTHSGIEYIVCYAGATVFVIKESGKGRKREITIYLNH